MYRGTNGVNVTFVTIVATCLDLIETMRFIIISMIIITPNAVNMYNIQCTIYTCIHNYTDMQNQK